MKKSIGNDKPFLKDFAFYKSSFAAKKKSIEDQLKQFARMYDYLQEGGLDGRLRKQEDAEAAS